MRSIIFLFSLIVLTLYASCSKKILKTAIETPTELEDYITKTSTKRMACNCNDPQNYIPDEDFPQLEDFKYIRLNFHYPNTTDKRYNFTEIQR